VFQLKKNTHLFFVGFEVIKITFKRYFTLNKPRFIVSLYFACFYIKLVLFGLFVADVLFLSIRKSGLKWAYGGLILGTSTGHPRLKYKLFFSSDEKKIVFVFPIIQSKKARTLNLKTNSAGWFKLLARFFWKIALSDWFYFIVNALGNLLKK